MNFTGYNFNSIDDKFIRLQCKLRLVHHYMPTYSVNLTCNRHTANHPVENVLVIRNQIYNVKVLFSFYVRCVHCGIKCFMGCDQMVCENIMYNKTLSGTKFITLESSFPLFLIILVIQGMKITLGV